MSKKIEAEFIENFLVIWNPEDSSRLFRMGFYGKPLGIAKPKSPDFDVPLILDLMEGLYLVEQKTLKVIQGVAKNKVGFRTLKSRARGLYKSFDLKYTVYRDLRNQGLIVTPGVKYGCDFAVYKQGPGVDHAPYMISVRSCKDGVTATEIVKTGRLATTVRKRFIAAVPDLEYGKVEYLIFKWFKA